MASNNPAVQAQFRGHLEKYITGHDCYGLSAGDDVRNRPFVPRAALVNFWDWNRVVNVLGKETRSDIQKILGEYLVVFSILVHMSKPESINLFMSTETRLNDAQLPISAIPIEWTHVPENQSLLEEFQKHQWRFCPLVFDHRRYMSKLNPYHILPITNKKLIDPDADEEEDDVLVYQADWHQTCLGLLPSAKVVLKEYHMRSEQVTNTLQNEVDIYSNLQESAFEHIVRYFGSFEQQGKLTIVLEYAVGGTLSKYMDETAPPAHVEDKIELWGSFFQLLLGLNATHNFNAPSHNNPNQWLLKGIHQDIRPQNILITGTEPNSYTAYFKLTDFGTGHVRSCRAQGFDPMGDQRQGNGMYSAPESYRDHGITTPQLCESDIWSMGGVASELLVWSIKGEAKRLEYQNRRCQATGKTPLSGGFHEGNFHDRECRLSVVDDEHKLLLEYIDDDDTVSPLVSHIILDHMLVANVAERSSAINSYRAWEAGLNHILDPEWQPPHHKATRDSHMSGWSANAKRHSINSVLSHPRPDHGHWFDHSLSLSSEPAPMSTSGYKNAMNRDDPPLQNIRYLRHVQYGDRTGNGDPGPSRPPRPFAPGIGRGIRPQTSESTGLESLIEPIPESTNGGATVPNSTTSSPSPLRHPNVDTLSQNPTSPPTAWAFSNLTPKSSPPEATPIRQSADEHYGVPDVSEPMSAVVDTGLGIDSSPTPRRPKMPAIMHSNTPASRYPAPKLLNRASTFLPEADRIVTVNDLYETIISTEGSGFLGKVASSGRALLAPNKSVLLTQFPQLKAALEKLRGYKGREQIFIVDDSFSMHRHREELGKTIRVLARALKEGGVDPDKKISLYYTCTTESISLKNAKYLQDNVRKHRFSKDPCQFGTKLDEITSDLLESDGPTPLSIYILTNGRWNARPDDPHDLDGVDEVIKKILNSNETKSRRSNHVGFQFVRFYHYRNRDDREDDVAKERLNYLDDDLPKKLKEQGVRTGKRDIIDTTDWDGDVCKMLLGGVYTEDDD